MKLPIIKYIEDASEYQLYKGIRLYSMYIPELQKRALGAYYHSINTIYIVKQENNKLTRHILIHELCHWIIDKFFFDNELLQSFIDKFDKNI